MANNLLVDWLNNKPNLQKSVQSTVNNNTASNAKNITTPNLNIGGINLQQAQANVNAGAMLTPFNKQAKPGLQVTPPNAIPNSKIQTNNPAFNNGQLVNNSPFSSPDGSSRFIGFQQQPKVANTVLEKTANERQGLNFDAMRKGQYSFVPTQLSKAEASNKVEEERYRTMSEAFYDLQGTLYDRGKVLNEYELRQKFPEFKNLDTKVLMELQNELLPIVKDGMGVEADQISQLYPELLKGKDLKDTDSIKKEVEQGNKWFKQLSKVVDIAKGDVEGMSSNGVQSIQDAKTIWQIVQSVKKDGVVGGGSDYEILKELYDRNEEVKKLVDDFNSLELSEKDKAIWGKSDSNVIRQLFHDISAPLRKDDEFMKSNEELESLKNKSKAMEEDYWGQVGGTAKVGLRSSADVFEKFIYRMGKDAKLWTIDDIDEYLAQAERNEMDVKEYNKLVDANTERVAEDSIDPDVREYYNNHSMSRSLALGDVPGFFLQSTKAATENVDMPIIIGLGVVAPEVVLPLMATDTYVRESEDAFEQLLDNGASYDDAEQGAVVVGLANTAVELWLEKAIGGVETTASRAIRDALMKDISKQTTEMVAKRGLVDLAKQGLSTQFRSSLEEGLEEIVQQSIQNYSVSKYNPDVKITDGLREAFEGGFFNPMNLLAGGGEIISNVDVDAANQWAYNQGVKTREFVDNAKDSLNNGAYNAGAFLGNMTEDFKNNVINPQGGTNNTQISQQQGTVNTTSENQNNINGSNYNQNVKNNKTLNKVQLGMLQNDNRMNPSKITEFKEKFGEDYGQALADRGYTESYETNVPKIEEDTKEIYNQKKAAMNSVQGEFKDRSLRDMINLMLKKAKNTLDYDMIDKYNALKQKHNSRGLTMEEANDMREEYSYKIQTKWHKDNNSDKIDLADNVYMAVKNFLEKTAEQNGIKDLKQMNREIAMRKFLSTWIGDKAEKQSANNMVSLTDWVILAEAVSNPYAAAGFAAKKIAQTPKVKNAVLNAVVGRRQNRAIDTQNRQAANQQRMESIERANEGKQLQQQLSKPETPALPNGIKLTKVTEIDARKKSKSKNNVTKNNNNKKSDSSSSDDGGTPPPSGGTPTNTNPSNTNPTTKGEDNTKKEEKKSEPKKAETKEEKPKNAVTAKKSEVTQQSQSATEQMAEKARQERERLDNAGIKPAQSLPKGHKWNEEGAFTVTTPGGSKLTFLPIGDDLYIKNWAQVWTKDINNTVIENYKQRTANELTNFINGDLSDGDVAGGIMTEAWHKMGLPLGLNQSVLKPLNPTERTQPKNAVTAQKTKVTAPKTSDQITQDLENEYGITIEDDIKNDKGYKPEEIRDFLKRTEGPITYTKYGDGDVVIALDTKTFLKNPANLANTFMMGSSDANMKVFKKIVEGKNREETENTLRAKRIENGEETVEKVWNPRDDWEKEFKEKVGDKFYNYMQNQVDIKNDLARENGGDKVTLKDMEITYFMDTFEKMAQEEVKEIQEELNELTKDRPQAKMTDAQREQLNGITDQNERNKLLKKWQDEWIKSHPISDEDAAKVGELMDRAAEVVEGHKKARNYLYELEEAQENKENEDSYSAPEEENKNKVTNNAKNKVTNITVEKGQGKKVDNSSITGRFRNLTREEYRDMQKFEGLETLYLEGKGDTIYTMLNLKDAVGYLDPAEYGLPEDFEFDYHKFGVREAAKDIAEIEQILDKLEKDEDTSEDEKAWGDYMTEKEDGTRERNTKKLIEEERTLLRDMVNDTYDGDYDGKFVSDLYEQFSFAREQDKKKGNDKYIQEKVDYGMDKIGALVNKYGRYWEQGNDSERWNNFVKNATDIDNLDDNETPQIPTIFEEDLEEMNLRDLDENETPQMVEEEGDTDITSQAINLFKNAKPGTAIFIGEDRKAGVRVDFDSSTIKVPGAEDSIDITFMPGDSGDKMNINLFDTSKQGIDNANKALKELDIPYTIKSEFDENLNETRYYLDNNLSHTRAYFESNGTSWLQTSKTLRGKEIVPRRNSEQQAEYDRQVEQRRQEIEEERRQDEEKRIKRQEEEAKQQEIENQKRATLLRYIDEKFYDSPLGRGKVLKELSQKVEKSYGGVEYDLGDDAEIRQALDALSEKGGKIHEVREKEHYDSKQGKMVDDYSYSYEYYDDELGRNKNVQHLNKTEKDYLEYRLKNKPTENRVQNYLNKIDNKSLRTRTENALKKEGRWEDKDGKVQIGTQAQYIEYLVNELGYNPKEFPTGETYANGEPKVDYMIVNEKNAGYIANKMEYDYARSLLETPEEEISAEDEAKLDKLFTPKTTTEVTGEKNAVTAKPVETNKPKNLVTSKSKVDEIIEDSNGKELKFEDDGVVKTISYEKDGVTYAYNVNNAELKELSDRGAIKNEKAASNGEIQEITKDEYFDNIFKNRKDHLGEMFFYKDGYSYYPIYILSSGKAIAPENTYRGEVSTEEAARNWLLSQAEEHSEENEVKKAGRLKGLVEKTAKKYEDTLKRIESDDLMKEIWVSGDYFKYGLKESQMAKAKKESEANAHVGTFKKEVIKGKEGYRIYVAGTKNQALWAFYEPETGKIYKIYRGPVLDDSVSYTTKQIDRIEKFLGNVEEQLDRETKVEKVEKKDVLTQEWLDSLKPDKDGVVELDYKEDSQRRHALEQGKEPLVKEGKADGKYLYNYGGPKYPQYSAFYIKDGVVYEGRKGLDNQYMKTKQEAVDWLNQKEKDVQHEGTPRYEQTDYETLPKTISVEEEAEKAGPKRIAPDRVKRQQETYDAGLNNVKDILKQSPVKIYELGFKSDRSKAAQDMLAERRRIRELPESEAEVQWNELARGIYEDLVVKDISKGYRYPEDVTSKFPKAQMKKAVDARARYEKGLFTSFSSKDTRANYQYRDEIGAGIKSQDGKPVTQAQMDEIVEGVRSFGKVFGLDMKKFAEDNGIIYVHLHGGNPFLMGGGGKSRGGGMNIAGLYRRGADGNISISLGGVELVMEKGEDGEMKKNNVNATPEHELAHAVDYMLENKLFSSSDIEILKSTMNQPTRLINYYNRSQEIVARAVEQYAASKTGKSRYGKPYVESQAYWNQDKFDKYVKPIVEKNMNEKLQDYKLGSTSKNSVTASDKNKVTNG